MAVGWSQRARADLGEIFAHIAADDRGAAERWNGRILEHTDLAAEAPLLGRIVPELGQADIRETYLRTLLKRVHDVDALACPCGGRLRVIALITEPEVVAAILTSLHLPAAPPPIARARSPDDYDPASD